MALKSTSNKNILDDYHRLAADTLLGQSNSRLNEALLSAAEDGQFDRLQSLLTNPKASLDARCPSTGDTPLIVAARNGHERIVKLLIQMGADVTLQNDLEESALEVGSKKIKQTILDSIKHEGRMMTNAQALLQNAWLGDAVSVKQNLSGNHYLDVNCNNNDGLSPLLLVTRDINLFDSIQTAMETEYNPVEVMQELLDNHANIDQTDPKGRSALHYVATSESVHAKKMVSLLMRRGSQVDSLDSHLNSPLHIASDKGSTAIIIALVEEGGADVNSKGGERNDTPLMLTARAGHSEAARYLLAKGADVTAVDDNGDSALSVAATNSMVSLLKEAWTEQTKSKSEANIISESPEKPEDSAANYSVSLNDLDNRSSQESPTSSLHSNSFFLTEQRLSQSFERPPVQEGRVQRPRHASEPNMKLNGKASVDETDWGSPLTRSGRVSETSNEADDELDGGLTMQHVSQQSKDMSKRYSVDLPSTADNLENDVFAERPKSRSLPRNLTADFTKLAMEANSPKQNPIKTQRRSEVRRPNQSKKTKARPFQLPIDPKSSEAHLTRSQAKLAKNRSKDKLLPDVVKTPPQSPRLPFSHSHSSHQKTSTSNKLPVLNNMKAVAMVAVDTERDKLKVHDFAGDGTKIKQPAAGRKHPMGRSKSMQPISPRIVQRSIAGRRGSGSVLPVTRRSDPNPPSKASLLPNVITPQLGPIGNAPDKTPPYSNFKHQRSHGRLALQPMKNVSPAPVQPPTPLSVVAESSESTRSSPSLNEGSEASTLKASSNSDFETDSLERAREPSVVARGEMRNPGALEIPATVNQAAGGLTPSPHLESHLFSLFPPTPGTAHLHQNLVTNWAVQQEGATPLSPIWNRMQQINSDTDSNSEYITSYIGRNTCCTPVPHKSGRMGVDSGQGESSDEASSDSDDASSPTTQKQASGEVQESLRWKRGRLLGKGAYGKVWEGLLDSAKLIAVKEVELDFEILEKAQAQYVNIQREVEILRSLRHRNIVSYLGTSLQEGVVFIFMDYISGGSLQSVLKRFGALPVCTISHYTKQITRALVYLHSNGIIHRDIKGANVMVTSKGVVKLIDFGCAKKYCQESAATGMHTVRGTPYWMSPEVICGHGYGRKSDVWSLGCTVHEMAITKPPWGDFPPEAALFQIGLGKSLPDLPEHLPTLLVAFIHRALTRDQNERPTAKDLLDDPFLNITNNK